MKTKILEIRDRATYIQVIAIEMLGSDSEGGWAISFTSSGIWGRFSINSINKNWRVSNRMLL